MATLSSNGEVQFPLSSLALIGLVEAKNVLRTFETFLSRRQDGV